MSVKLGDVEVAGFSGGGSIDAIDDITITKNNIDEIQAVAVIDQNTGITKTWTGTMAEYEAIVTKDPETEYIITDDIGGSATNIGQITEALNDKVDKGHEVIEFQAPTAINGYTWYRKYADGWVEQGGLTATATDTTVTLPVEMADTNYSIVATSYRADAGSSNASNNGLTVGQRTTTTFYIVLQESRAYFWEVKGMAA